MPPISPSVLCDDVHGVSSCTKVVRVAKHGHICGRWPTSRLHRFGRYVQRPIPMPRVVGPQRIKRARSAREDSSVYIYIYIYMYTYVDISNI